MRVLAFRHVAFEGLGSIAPVLTARGVGFDYVDLWRDGATLPEPERYDGLIFMGGPMSVNDALPYLIREMQLIERARAAAQPVLGICLGAQLTAKALGARVVRNAAKEIGWFDIHFTKAGREDSLFQGMEGPETVFHWHSETFDLPEGAELLAHSERCRNQAFRMGRSIYGLQFHPEVTPEMISDWQLQDENCGDVRELPVPIDPWRNRNRLNDFLTIILGRWCDLL